ncbi:MAG: hypothetical protein NC244_07755 [Alistipes senegalensis]|nr:hypothetical protein [Alistipes senegalensis]
MIKWNVCNSYLTSHGETRRDREIYETQQSIIKRSKDSPAYKTVLIDGKEQQVVITSASNLYEKKINALPNEHIYAGSTVEWNGRYWLIQYTDCEDEVYQRGFMQQCNICLKWQNSEGDIIVRYGYSEDITEYVNGVVFNKILDSLQLSFKINLPIDKETVKLRRGKRFLLDVVTDEPNAYILTNRNTNTLNFLPKDINGETEFDGRDKIMQITITQTQLSERDNRELMIADYFDSEADTPPAVGNCKITYKGKNEIKLGGSFKTFSAQFFDINGNEVSIVPKWTVTSTEEAEKKLVIDYSENELRIKAPDYAELMNIPIKIELSDEKNEYYSEIYTKVVSLYG